MTRSSLAAFASTFVASLVGAQQVQPSAPGLAPPSPAPQISPALLGPDQAKISSVHYRIGRWIFDPIYGPDRAGTPNYGPQWPGSMNFLGKRRVSMIVARWSRSQPEDAGVVGAGYGAVIYVRSAKDWPALLGPLPEHAEASTGWLHAYWKPDAEFYSTLAALARQEGGEALSDSAFWDFRTARKITDDAPITSTSALERDPVNEASLHPAKVPPFKDREEWKQGPPAWHPSGCPCESVTAPAISEAVVFQKLLYVFEVMRSAAPSVSDPDPCMLSCPGEVVQIEKPAPLTYLRTDRDEKGQPFCVYGQAPIVVWRSNYCPSFSMMTIGPAEWRFLAPPVCPPASSLPTSPFDLHMPLPGAPSACPMPEKPTAEAIPASK